MSTDGPAPSDARHESQPKFELLTQQLIPGSTDFDGLNDRVVSVSKNRRGSVRIGEDLFVQVVNARNIEHIIEAGGNDGRHTRHFIEATDAHVHVFEPNIYASSRFHEIFGHSRLSFNAYGLSNATHLQTLRLPRELLGRSLESRISGVASVEARDDVGAFESITAPFATAHDYVEQARIGPPESLALWLDVEGHAVAALRGFEEALGESVDVALIEVEYDDIYLGGANADGVLEIIAEAGLSVVYRDFMNVGQCNLLAVRDRTSVNGLPAYRQAQEFYGALGTAELDSR